MIINSLILQSCKTKQNFNMHVPRVTFNNPIASNIYVYIYNEVHTRYER